MSHVELGPLGLQLLLREDNIQLDELQVYICANAWISQQDLSGCRRSLIRKASSRRESEAKKDREGDESSKGRRRRKEEEEDEQGGGGGKGQDEENLRGGEHEIEDDDADADAQTDSLIMVEAGYYGLSSSSSRVLFLFKISRVYDIYRSIRFDSMSPSQIQ
ncbi:gyf domain, partial [Cystoisospora suis]